MLIAYVKYNKKLLLTIEGKNLEIELIPYFRKEYPNGVHMGIKAPKEVRIETEGLRKKRLEKELNNAS